MPLDVTGVELGTLIATALALPPPPTNPTPEQEATYTAAVAANKATWITICNQLLTYLVAKTVVTTSNTDSVNIPPSGVATIIAPPTGGPCTGDATGTATGTGTGTIK